MFLSFFEFILNTKIPATEYDNPKTYEDYIKKRDNELLNDLISAQLKAR